MNLYAVNHVLSLNKMQESDGFIFSKNINIRTNSPNAILFQMTESDLLINSDERCGSSTAEDENKETNENSNGTGQVTRKRAERRCTLYKKHSCQAPAHRNYTTLACNNRSHR